MLATLALAALSLVPAQPGDLNLTNKRVTYGPLGQERKEKQFIVGDLFCLSFDIEGLKVQDDGKVLYSLGLKLVDGEGKLQFEQEPRDLDVTNSLGGSRTAANAIVDIRTDTKPGKYTCTVSVADRLAKTKKELTHEFEVVAPRLGLVQTHLTYPTGVPAAPVAVVGQAYIINFAVTGMKLNDNKQPHLSVELRVIDEATGKPTLVKNPSDEIKNLPEEFKKLAPFQFPLQLNRPGRFRVEFKVKDLNDNGKTVEQVLSFTVSDQK
jgi:hypothetical protein